MRCFPTVNPKTQVKRGKGEDNMWRKTGFTIIELIFLLIVIAMLMAILIPAAIGMMSKVREEDREQLIKNIEEPHQLVVWYRAFHDGYPGDPNDPGAFARQMTQWTDREGGTSESYDSEHYIFPCAAGGIPSNPFTHDSTVVVAEGKGTAFEHPEKDGGWWFNKTTGELRPNLTAAHKQNSDEDSEPLNTVSQCASYPEDVRMLSLKMCLARIRCHISQYKKDHGVYPGHSGNASDFFAQLMNYTNKEGKTSNKEGPDSNKFRYKPLLEEPFPANPASGLLRFRMASEPAAAFSPPAKKDGGWWYNPATGEFRADLRDRRLNEL